MSDQREAIMQRLETVLAGVAGIATVRRNEIEFDETQLPAIGLLEGDEQANDSDATRGRPSDRPYLVTMMPQVYVREQTGSNAVGTRLNQFRAAIIKAVLQDEALNALTLDGRGIRYVSAESTLHAGRSMVGATALVFAFSYRLMPSEL